jgi:hypothetical protein
MLTTRLAALGAATLAVLSLLLAGGGAALANDASTRSDTRLLDQFRPVLVFHPDEQFRPLKAQRFVQDSELEQFVGTNPQQLPLDVFWTVVDPDPDPDDLPAPTPGVFFRLDQTTCEADAALGGRDCYAAAAASNAKPKTTMYGRVVTTDTRVVLQYWLFYYDNPLILPATPVGPFWQSHEGDWELVNVILDSDGQPLEAAYSQHCSGQRKAWSEVEKDGDHPVAYVALGSHANYFAPGAGALGAIPIKPACIPPAVAPILPLLPFLQVVDQVLAGPESERVQIRKIEGRPWASFGGRWGESEYFSTPIPLGPIPAGAVPIGLAPASPANQATWNPATILAWPTG